MVVVMKGSNPPITKSAIFSKFAAGKLAFIPIYRKGTFEKLLQSLDVITELSYDEPNVADPKYVLVKDQMRLDHRVLKFDVAPRKKGGPRKNSSRTNIIKFIKEKLLGRNVRSATARGKNSSGMDLPPISISPEVDSFGAYGYNEIVVAENLLLEDIANLPIIGTMIAVAKSHPAIFETPITN